LTTNIQLSQGHQTTEAICFPKVNLPSVIRSRLKERVGFVQKNKSAKPH